MQKRVYMFFNFFAFNLLFFALYLNFIHKDAVAAMPEMPSAATVYFNSPAPNLIEPVVKEVAKDTQQTNKKSAPAVKEGEALRLSVN